MNKKDFKSTASAIITRKPTTLEEALKGAKSDSPAKATTARTSQKNRQPVKTESPATQKEAKSKRATRREKAGKTVRKEVTITALLETKLKTARIALNLYENDIFNEALTEYLQRRDKEIKTNLKEKLGL